MIPFDNNRQTGAPSCQLAALDQGRLHRRAFCSSSPEPARRPL